MAETSRKKLRSCLVSIIVPVHNASSYLKEMFESVQRQSYRPIEVVVFDDCSSDNSMDIICEWKDILSNLNIKTIIGQATSANGKGFGPGYARNEAVLLSSGDFICHLDADDMMTAQRIEKQVTLALERGNDTLIGSNFDRYPLDSTQYYTNWINEMSENDLHLQQFRECTIICPSWLYSRELFDKIAQHRAGRIVLSISEEATMTTVSSIPLGDSTSSSISKLRAFVECTAGEQLGLQRVPEDLMFFLDHLQLGGKLAKVPEALVTYRYSPGSWALGTSKVVLQAVRCAYLERMLLSTPEWSSFTIWGYGKDGKKFLSMLSTAVAEHVAGFCDVDPHKIGPKKYFCNKQRRHIPVLDYREAKPPFIICVASKRCGGELESNIKSLGHVEGVHYYHFC